ncbi:MAG: S49 family peptidase [Rhizobiales bacterium]|nr:S49 family peptidase [Hyphomicrobiales bacterium]
MTKPIPFPSRLLPARFRSSAKTVPLVRLHGAIGINSPVRQGLSMVTVNPVLEKAFSVKGIPAVAISINSPGGSPVQSKLIHDRIRQLAAKHEVEVYTFCEDVAASGGYMLAIAGDEIYADRSSIIGSIGVVAAGFGFVEAIKKLGVERRVHTAGKNKAILDAFQPEKKQDVERLKKLQLEIHQGFIDLVQQRRGAKLPDQEGDLFTGAFWAAPGAHELGLIDGLGNLHEVLEKKFGDKVKIKLVSKPSGMSLRRLFGAGDTKEQAGINVNLNPDLAEDLVQSLEIRALWQRFGL